MDWTPIVIALLAALPGLMALRSNNKRIESEASERIAAAEKIKYEVTEDVLAAARSEMDRCHKEIDRMQVRINELAALVDSVENELATERKARLALEKELELERKTRIMAEQRVDKYIIGIRALTKQLVDQGHSPVWQPDPTGPLAKS
jgi:chromosome segregation ATPase